MIKAIQNLYNVEVDRRKVEINWVIEQWSPYKSIAALYLWEWVDNGMQAVPDDISKNIK